MFFSSFKTRLREGKSHSKRGSSDDPRPHAVLLGETFELGLDPLISSAGGGGSRRARGTARLVQGAVRGSLECLGIDLGYVSVI